MQPDFLASAAHAVPPEVADAIRGASKIALAGHVTPDADCLGAMGALSLALPELGKHTHLALPEGTVSRKLLFLLQYGAMRPATMHELRACDLLIVVDTAKDRRVNIEGKLEALPGIAVLNIDHHSTNPLFGRWNYVRTDASSSCELVYDVLAALGCRFTPTIATLLYAGLHSDTRGFSLSNTTPRSLLIGHALAAAGARIEQVCERLDRSHSRGEIDLLRTVYANLRVSEDGLLAWSTLSHDEIERTGCSAADIDSQVDVPRSVEGIRIAILFSEGTRGKVRMNFRGERGASALGLAQQFGGGGHYASAGAMLDGSIEDVSARVVEAARRYAAALPPASEFPG